MLALPCGSALAQTDEVYAEPSELQRQVEESGAAYDEATQRLKELRKQTTEGKKRLEELDAQIAVQKEACEESLRELYKLHRGESSLLSMVLSSDSLGSFLSTMEYLNRLQQAHSDNLAALNELHEERTATQEALDAALAEATEEQARAQAAFDEARARRDAAQEAARATSAEDAQALQEMALSITGATPDGADWTMDRAAFINAWKGRLNAYFEGSPLAGYGMNFAAAAWENGIDPRFSAAISCMESSKGRYCFLPHNAWGWGQASWGSWEEAISAHARGLARGYGYTLTLAGAKKYCPPNWAHWYDTVGSEMSRI